MPYENFVYVVSKDMLPDLAENSTCPICWQPIEIFENDQCKICENGHRMHASCNNAMIKNFCPTCRGSVNRYCHGLNKKLGEEGYSYHPRKGGNYKKYKKLKTAKRKYSSKSSKKNKRTRYHKKK